MKLSEKLSKSPFNQENFNFEEEEDIFLNESESENEFFDNSSEVKTRDRLARLLNFVNEVVGALNSDFTADEDLQDLCIQLVICSLLLSRRRTNS